MAKYALLTTLQLDVANFSSGIKSAVKETDNLKTGVNSAAKSISDSFKDISTMSIGQMKRELSSLKNISFAGKSEEELTKIKTRMGSLMDEMGDFRAQATYMGKSLGENLASVAQAALGLSNIIIGLAQSFGLSKEASEKLTRVTITSIGAIQGITLVTEVYKSSLIQTTFAQAKDIISKGLLAAKTAIVTTAQWAWNVAMTANPIGLIVAAVALLIAGIVLLTKWLGSASDSTKKLSRAQEESEEQLKKLREEEAKYVSDINTKSLIAYEEERLKLGALLMAYNDNTASLTTRRSILKDIIALNPAILSGLNEQNISTSVGIGLLQDYNAELMKRAYINASAAKLQKKIEQKIDIQLQIDALKSQIKADEDARSNFGKVVKDLQKKIGVEYLKEMELEALKITLGELENEIAILTGTVTKNTAADILSAKTTEELTEKQKAEAEALKKSNEQFKERNKILNDAKALVKWWNDNPLAKEGSMPKAGGGTTFKDIGSKDFNATMQGKSNIPQIQVDYYKTQLSSLKQYGEDVAKQTQENWQKVDQADISGIRAAQERYQDFLRSLTDTMKSGLQDFADVIGEELAKVVTGEFTWKTFFVNILDTLGGFLKQLGSAAIAYGIAMLAIKNAWSNPIAAIAAGVGLIAAGALISRLSTKLADSDGGASQFADGGIVGGTLYSGDQVLARVNSGEMILNQAQQAELFKMANGGQTYGAGDVRFEIEGTKLVGVLNNYNRQMQKTR